MPPLALALFGLGVITLALGIDPLAIGPKQIQLASAGVAVFLGGIILLTPHGQRLVIALLTGESDASSPSTYIARLFRVALPHDLHLLGLGVDFRW